MRWISLTFLLGASLSALLGQQPAAPAPTPTDPKITWEFNSGG